MARQTVEATFDDAEVVAFFKGMRTRLSKIKNGDKKFGGLLSSIIFGEVQEHFERQEGHAGPWEKWSSVYRKQMEKKGRAGNKILQYSGKLRQNFKPGDYRSTGQDLIWYNDARTKSGFPYAALHDEGGPKHPQRDFMWLSDKGAEKISNITLQFLIDEGV